MFSKFAVKPHPANLHLILLANHHFGHFAVKQRNIYLFDPESDASVIFYVEKLNENESH